ncbi:MAG TPA: NAD-dependent epimerase/dehydratase family protein [Pseudonocardiaceae bacterium]|jgi:UDP-glucose 4-epimerase|nr:NAD-dependent epimerase/dehydratase family protein [Pseudonocardiaceae bacterium]
MRVAIIGGTRFIGRRITEALVRRGDEVLVVHRGVAEPQDWVPCRHLHVDRRQFGLVADQVRAFAPDAVVDTLAMTRTDADAVLPHLPEVPLVLLSSMDVYRAYELALSGQAGIPVPLVEDSPLRQGRYPHRGTDPGLEGYELDMDHYDKLDVEPLYLQRGAIVLRLGMVYGEGDVQQREEFILRRVRASRRRIPIGEGTWRWTRIYVGDVARAVLAALDTPEATGEVFNVGESATPTMREWVGQILAAADHDAELVTVPAAVLPPDLIMTGRIPQDLLAGNDKARRVMGWQPSDQAEAVGRSVRWHLAHPLAHPDTDFTADTRALVTPR